MAEDLVMIALDCVGDIFPCAICGGNAVSQPGPNLVERATNRFVCRTCGKEHAPKLLALVDFDNRVYGIGANVTQSDSWEAAAKDYWRKVYGQGGETREELYNLTPAQAMRQLFKDGMDMERIAGWMRKQRGAPEEWRNIVWEDVMAVVGGADYPSVYLERKTQGRE